MTKETIFEEKTSGPNISYRVYSYRPNKIGPDGAIVCGELQPRTEISLTIDVPRKVESQREAIDIVRRFFEGPTSAA